jgi:hypothetical protein
MGWGKIFPKLMGVALARGDGRLDCWRRSQRLLAKISMGDEGEASVGDWRRAEPEVMGW